MKKYMSYEELKTYSIMLSTQVSDTDNLVAISRGGITAAHIIAKRTRKKIHYYFPDTNEIFPPVIDGGLFFIEDLIAQGRTYDKVKEYCKSNKIKKWSFNVILIDGDYEGPYDNINSVLSSIDWIVFPYEEMEMMNEGDRGLFREDTDNYGK